MSIEKRIERLEQEIVPVDWRPKLVVWYTYTDCGDDDFLPNVFDRPLEDWELYKDVIAKGKILLMLNPHAEAELRGGVAEQVLARRYDEWAKQQKDADAEISVELRKFATPKLAQNGTKPDR